MIDAFDKSNNVLDVTGLLSTPQKQANIVFEFEPNPSWLNLTPYRWNGVGVAKLVATITDEKVLLTGQIIIPAEYVCSRCAVKFEENLFIEVNETLTENSADEEHFKIVANKINLLDVVGELVTLSVPTQVLCKEDCLGICPHCGTNLNEGACDCKDELVSGNPFAQFKDKFN